MTKNKIPDLHFTFSQFLILFSPLYTFYRLLSNGATYFAEALTEFEKFYGVKVFFV